MKYAHLFHKLFGLTVLDWDDARFLHRDFLWMKAAADDWVKQQKEAAR